MKAFLIHICISQLIVTNSRERLQLQAAAEEDKGGAEGAATREGLAADAT